MRTIPNKQVGILMVPANPKSEVICIGDYTKPRSSSDPFEEPEPAEFEIKQIWYKGVDISEVIPDNLHYELTQRCITKIQDE